MKGEQCTLSDLTTGQLPSPTLDQLAARGTDRCEDARFQKQLVGVSPTEAGNSDTHVTNNACGSHPVLAYWVRS
jgi:hypothetical protein